MTRMVRYSCPFVPAEWIAAHGLRPSRALPRPVGAGMPVMAHGEGLCPYAREFAEDLASMADDDLAVMTTTCDQMRRINEWLPEEVRERCFMMHVPTSWESASAQRYYRDELRRLGRWLQNAGGRSPDAARLREVMMRFDATRARILDARPYLAAREFAAVLRDFFEGGDLADLPGTGPIRTGGIPIGIVGGPLLEDHWTMLDRIENAGGRVALDATAFGERTLPRAFQRRQMREDPFGELADAYFGHIPDAFRRPNSMLYIWLRDMIRERQLRALIFHHYVWCDTWHAEMERMREWADIPLLGIETGDDASLTASAISRLDAFLEVLA